MIFFVTTLIMVEIAGATIPGLADAENGIWKFAPFSGIGDIPFARLLSERLSVPVVIENDVNACAIAEHRLGAAKDCGDFLWMTVSNGIGGALFLGGSLYAGAFGGSGEIGHLKVAGADAPLCGCGKRGCLEAVASGKGIERAYAEKTGERITAKEIAARAEAGDTTAAECYARAGAYMGDAISHSVNLLNLKRVILGGGVVGGQALFMPALLQSYREKLFEQANADVEIGISSLGYNAALLGAAAIADIKRKGK